MIADLRVYSPDTVMLLRGYRAETELSLPLVDVILDVREDQEVGNDEDLARRIDAMRAGVMEYLRWRLEHTDADAWALVAELVPKNSEPKGGAEGLGLAERAVGAWVSVRLLARHDYRRGMPYLVEHLAGLRTATIDDSALDGAVVALVAVCERFDAAAIERLTRVVAPALPSEDSA
ncbi:MAG: hypothetical protein AAF799_03965 [Myxococcota bacterium]